MSYEPQQPGRQQPAVENYPEAINGVVEVGNYSYNQVPQHNQNPQYPPPGDWGQLEVVPPPPAQGSANEKPPDNTVLRLKKTNFWLLALLVIVVIIAAVGGGVGGTLASKKKTTAAVADVITTTVISTFNSDIRRTSSSSSHNIATNVNITPTSSSSATAITPTATGGLENENQVIKTGMTASQYDSELKKWAGSNYRLTVVSGYSLGTEDGCAAIWEQKGGPAFSTRNGLDPTQYQSEFDNITAQGYYPVLVDGWTVSGTDHYAAIWRDSEGKTIPNWASRHGLNTTAFKTESDKWTSQGYCIKVLSGYAVGTQPRYAALWNECSTAANATVLKYAMSPGQYQTQTDTLSAQGYRISYVSGFAIDGLVYYNGIFTLGSATDWFAVYGFNSTGFQAKLEEMSDKGYNLSLVSTFSIGNSNLYAAIWDR